MVQNTVRFRYRTSQHEPPASKLHLTISLVTVPYSGCKSCQIVLIIFSLVLLHCLYLAQRFCHIAYIALKSNFYWILVVASHRQPDGRTELLYQYRVSMLTRDKNG